MNRFFHTAGLVWSSCVLLVVLLGLNPVICAIAGAVLFSILILQKRRLPLWCFATATAICGSMLSLSIYQQTVVAPAHAWEGKTAQLRAAVVDREEFPSYTRLTLRTEKQTLPEELSGIKIRVPLFTQLEVELGDVVECTVKLSAKQPEKRLAKAIRFDGVLLEEVKSTGERSHSLETWLANYRERLSDTLKWMLPGEEGKTLAGMLTGRSEEIPGDLRKSYSDAGVSHLLAVSGMHLAVLSGMLDALLRRTWLSLRARTLILMLSAAGFCGLAGFSPSAVRAAWMLLLTLSARLLGEGGDTLNFLGFAVILLLIQNPYAIFGLSLQLSYLATLGIAGLCTPLSEQAVKLLRVPVEKRPRVYPLMQACLTSVCATITTAPILCWQFGKIALASLPANLLIAPLAPLALGGGLLCAVMGQQESLLLFSKAAGLVGGLAVKAINLIARGCAALPLSIPARAKFLPFWMAGTLLLLVVVWYLRVGREKLWYAATLCGVLLLGVSFYHAVRWSNTAELTVANRGDTVTLVYQKQAAVIGKPKSATAAKELSEYLEERDVSALDLLVVQKADDLFSTPIQELIKEHPAQNIATLDRVSGMQAELFGCASIQTQGMNPQQIAIDFCGLRAVKTWKQRPVEADLLINARGELVWAEGCKLQTDDRFFHSTVVTMRISEDKGSRT